MVSEDEMRKIIIFILAFLLVSCSEPVSVSISSATPIFTEGIFPSPTPTGTAIALPPGTSTSTATLTPSPTITGTPTISPEVMRYQCLDTLSGLPGGEILKDVRVFALKTLDAYLDYGPTQPVIFFPKEAGDGVLFFQDSPDRKHILYRQTGSDPSFVIADAIGQKIWSIPAPKITELYYDWLDSQRLVEWKFNSPALPDVTLVNPFTGERQELPTDFPYFIFDEVNYGVNFPDWGAELLVFNPTLTRLVYPEMVNHEGGFPVTLWDLETNQPVARLVTRDYFGGNPFWLPDGKQFLIGTRTDHEDQHFANEFFLVNQDGQVRQITHFTDELKTVEINHRYSLSPNGRYFAFWITVQPGPYDDDRLAVLDIETGSVTNYCIPGDPFQLGYSADSLSAPIWSPDSTQLLVTNRDPQTTTTSRVVLVDIMKGWAAQIAGDVEPVGWMLAPKP
jgi:hypothetical protein